MEKGSQKAYSPRLLFKMLLVAPAIGSGTCVIRVGRCTALLRCSGGGFGSGSQYDQSFSPAFGRYICLG